MSEILLPFPDDLKGDGLVAYLNEHIDKLRQAHELAHNAEHALSHAIPKLDTAVVHAYPAHATY